MNRRSPDTSESGAASEGAVLRFLRWLLEPPVAPQSASLRVLRQVLRVVGWIVYAAVVGPDDGHGNGGVRPRGGKPGEPPT